MMPAGLVGAQVAHAQNLFLKEQVSNDSIELSKDQRAWMFQPYISILGIQTAEELDMIVVESEEANLPTFVWEDTVPSPSFRGQFIEAKVAVAIGPADFDAIKRVTGHLDPYPSDYDVFPRSHIFRPKEL
jgi:peptidyl-tRNA hydrolase